MSSGTNENKASADPLFGDYRGESWLYCDGREPARYTRNRIAWVLKEAEKYPMEPGLEVGYPDDKTPQGMLRQDVLTPQGISMTVYEPAAAACAEDDRIIFYIHGGGFMRGNEQWNRANAITLVRHFGLPVYCMKYRIIPEHKYPAGLNDVEQAWNYLVEDLGIAPERLILAGESAGATYALALTVRLQEHNKALPGGIAAFSAFLDMAAEGASYTYNKDRDPVFAGFSVQDCTVPAYTDEEDVRQPEISPLYADMTGFPPTFFSSDDHEIFVSDALRTAKKMAECGVPVRCSITHDLMHAFEFEVPDTEEAGRIFKEAKAFLDMQTGGGRHMGSCQ